MKKYNTGIYIFNDVEVLDFAGPYEVFSVSSELNNYELFNVFTVSNSNKEIKTINGLKVTPDYGFDNHPKIDILIIPGGDGRKIEMNREETLNWVKTQHKTSNITASICTGAFILAGAGVLDGIDIITHHACIKEFKKNFPTISVLEQERFVERGKVITGGGISAGIDLSLHIVNTLFGKEIELKTKSYMEYGDWR